MCMKRLSICATVIYFGKMDLTQVCRNECTFQYIYFQMKTVT